MADGMAQGPRVVIGLHVEMAAAWQGLQAPLRDLGAIAIGKPDAQLPGVFIVQLPADGDAEAFSQAAARLPGVRYAEPERFSFSSAG